MVLDLLAPGVGSAFSFIPFIVSALSFTPFSHGSDPSVTRFSGLAEIGAQFLWCVTLCEGPKPFGMQFTVQPQPLRQYGALGPSGSVLAA